MLDEKPEVVSKVSVLTTLMAVAFAIVGCIRIIKPGPVLGAGPIAIGLAILFFVFSRRFLVIIYSDRMVAKYLFSQNTRIIFLEDITSWTETTGGKGGKILTIYIAGEEFDLPSMMFSNYEEMKNKITAHAPQSKIER